MFDTKIALYQREIELLKKHNFEEEVSEKFITEEEKWILTDLKQKGVLYNYNGYYQGTCIYKQIKELL